MSRWLLDSPDGRKFALIYTEGYEYQVAQWDPMLEEWAFYYKERLICINPLRVTVWWHAMPRPPKDCESPYIDKVFALEKKDEEF